MDRRVVLAVVLMMAIAMLPAVLFKRTPLSNRPVSTSTAPAAPVTAPPPAALTTPAP